MKYALAAFTLCLATSAMAAEKWDVTEGSGSSTQKGNWIVQKDGDNYSVTGTMFSTSGQKTLVTLQGKKQGNILSLHQTDTLAALDCSYRITIAPNASGAAGARMCRTGQVPLTVIFQH